MEYNKLELQKMLKDKKKEKNYEKVENTEEKKKTGRQKFLNGNHKQYLEQTTFNEDSPHSVRSSIGRPDYSI